MEENTNVLANGRRRIWFVAIVAYYVLATYLVPSSAKVERFSFAYFALVIPAWLYVAVNWRCLLTGYGMASKMLALFAVLAGISGVLRGDYPLAYNAVFLSAMAIVILNSKAYLNIVEMNGIFLATVVGSVVVDVLGITEYGFFPQAKEGNCEDAMNWRVSLFRVTAESAMFSMVVLISNLAYGDRMRGWTRGLILLVAAYFLIFSGVRSIVLASFIVIPICIFITLKRLAVESRRSFASGILVAIAAIFFLPYLLERGDGFWRNYLLRTESCAYKSRYLVPGHSDSVLQLSSSTQTRIEEQKTVIPIVPKASEPEHLPAQAVSSAPETDAFKNQASGIPRWVALDWIASTLNRQCAALYQLSLFVESPLGTRDIQPSSDQQLIELGCPPKQLSKYCASCTFITYWLARAGILAIPLLVFFIILMVDALKRKEAILAVALAAFGVVSFSWGVMFVPYNFIYLILMALPAFVLAHETQRKKLLKHEVNDWLTLVPRILRRRNVALPLSLLTVAGVFILWFFTFMQGCRKIDTANFVIWKSGNYCLTKDIEVAGSVGITVNAKNVDLNLEGRCIKGDVGTLTQTIGIHVRDDSANVKIKNGCISGMLYGIRSEPGVKQISISDVTLKSNRSRGLFLQSDNVIVRRVKVMDTGGTGLFDHANNIGIEVRAPNCQIIENEVLDTYPTDCGEGIGILQSSGEVISCEIGNNQISNGRVPKGGRTYGVWSFNDTLIHSNRIEKMTYSIVTTKPSMANGNTVIDQACSNQYHSNTFDLSRNTVFFLDSSQCPDDPVVARRHFSVRDRCSSFRLAQINHEKKNYREAAKYYFVSGTREALQQSEILRKLSLLTDAEIESAKMKAEKILADAQHGN